MDTRRLLWIGFLGSALFAGGCDGSTPAGTGGHGGDAGHGGSGGDGGNGGSGGAASGAPLVIDTKDGPVEGMLDGATRAFLGIPYAAPPVGDLRWKPPAPPAPWTDALPVKKKGPSCAQMALISGDFDDTTVEDCLTLNVWTPEKPTSDALPVLVWIHGGAFVLGSGGEGSYDGQALSEARGVVVVTLNYRLGPLGFLAHSLLKSEDAAHPSTGMYGIEDQRAALEWVKANISAFGGDPSRTMIFGESAGGISVCDHLVSPPSQGLFSSAIIESGPCENARDEASATAQGDDFAAALGCAAAPDVLACLREKPLAEVMTALPSSTDLLFGTGAKWGPIVDGLVLPDDPGVLLAGADFAKVPVVLGTNADEATLFFTLAGANGMVADEAEFAAFAEALVPGHGDDVVAAYPTAVYGSAQDAAIAAVGDAGFICPTRRMARSLSAGTDAYLYHFTYVPDGALLGDLGSFHSAEFKFVFGNPTQLLPKSLTEDELKMSGEIMGYWTRLAASGDPNGEGALTWPMYETGADEHLVIDLELSTGSQLKKAQCDFWDTVVIAGN